MIALKVFCAALLLACCSLGPGLVIVRRFRGWWPLERLCAAMGISLFVTYLAAAAIYGLGLGTWAYYGVSGICLVLLAVCARDLYGMLASIRARRALLGFGILVAWCLAALTCIRHYSGGGWQGDWLEHYQRCLFFLHWYPTNQTFINVYSLSARPPLMNLLGAFIMAQVGTDFRIFQMVFVVLNALIFLPCVLLASALARRGGRRIVLVVALFALNPMFIQNVTYTWTKLLGGFYTVLAVWVYLRALRKGDSLRLVLTVGLLTAGVLVHYSAAVYVVVLAVHYLVFAFRARRHKWRELLGGAATGAAMMATWLVWSIAVYGLNTTFGSNTAVTSASAYPGWSNVAKIGGNLFHTLVPHPPFRIAAKDVLFLPEYPMTYWRDYTFLIYQTNVIIAMGSVAGILIVGLFLARMLRKGTPGAQRTFWLTFVILTLIGGVAVVGEKDYFGLAHLCLQPLVLVGVTFLAANLPALPLVGRCAAALGAAFDFTVGVLLQLTVENISIEQVTEQVTRQGDRVTIIALEKMPLNRAAQTNLGSKFINDIPFWGDTPLLFLQLALAVGCVLMVAWMVKTGWRRPGAIRSGGGELPTGTTSDSAAARPKA